MAILRLVVPEPLILNQGANGDDVLTGHRYTDSTPTGNLIRFQDAGNVSDLFAVDVTGQLTAGNIPCARLSGTLAAGQHPALTGDLSSSAGSLTVSVLKVNGVSYPSGPTTDTVPVVTAANTITYQKINAAQIATSQVVKSISASAPLSASASTDTVSLTISDATTGAKGVVQVGTGISVSSGTISVAYGSTSTTAVRGDTSVTITAGTGMTGGGSITLGSGGTVTLTNDGVTTVQGTANQITPTTASKGAITLAFPVGGVTLPGKTTLTAATTSAASLNIPTGVAPTTPGVGDVWIDNTSTNKGLYTYYNGATRWQADTDSTQTLTNKTINASNNTLSNIPNTALTNSTIGFSSSGSISIGTASPALGGSTTLNLNMANANTWTALQTFQGSVALGTNPAGTGTLRLPNAGTFVQRNSGNTADITLLTMDASGHGTWANNWTIQGNLVVQGTTTTISSATLAVTDQNIALNNGGTIASSAGSGVDIAATDANGGTYSTLRIVGGRWQAPATPATAGAAYGTLRNLALVGNADVVDSIAAGTGITVSGTGAGPYTGATTVTLADANGTTKGGVVLTRDLGGTASAPQVVGIKGADITFTSLTSGQVLQYDGSKWVNVTLNSTTQWNSIASPGGAQALTMGNYATTWTWGTATGAATDMFVLTDGASNTGTGAIMNVYSGTTSAAKVVEFTARGTANGVYMDTTGNLQIMGTGKITANAYSGQLPIANGGTNANTAAAAFNNLSPLTTTGDILYASGTNTNARLAANSTATKKYLQSVSSTAPSWQQIDFADLSGSAAVGQLPDATASAKGIIQLAGDLAAGTAAAPQVAKLKGVSVDTPSGANKVLVSSGTTAAAWGTVPNSALTSSSVTVTAGTGLSGGGAVALGSSITLNNSGVLSVASSDSSITVTTNSGAVDVKLPQTLGTASSPTFSGLTLSNKVTSIRGATTGGYYGVATDVNDVSNQILSTVSPYTVATFTPAQTGNFIVYLYFRVTTAATNLTVNLTWTDATGAQSMSMVTGLQQVGSYSTVPVFINATTSTAITITATAGTANQVYCSASVFGC